MALTDTVVRNAKPKDNKPYRLFDGGGLYVEVAPNGGKWWRFKFRFGGKEKRLSLTGKRDQLLVGALGTAGFAARRGPAAALPASRISLR